MIWSTCRAVSTLRRLGRSQRSIVCPSKKLTVLNDEASQATLARMRTARKAMEQPDEQEIRGITAPTVAALVEALK